MNRRLLLSVIFSGMALGLASTTWAQLPLGSNPPVRQDIGMLDTTTNFVNEAECRGCHDSGVPDLHHNLYGETMESPSKVPYPGGSTYTCLSCHGQNFTVQRNCVACHTTSPHHTTEDAVNRHCSECHGSLVADYDDGHYIPTYSASLVTPKRSLEGAGWVDGIVGGTPERISNGTGVMSIADLPATPPATPQTRKYPNTLKYEIPGLNNDFIISAPRGSTYNYTVTFTVGALGATWNGASATDKYLGVSVPALPTTTTANAIKAAINTAIGATWASLGFDGDPNDPLTAYPPYHYAPAGGEPLNNRDFPAGACSYCHWDDGKTDVNGDPAPDLILNNHDTHHGIGFGKITAGVLTDLVSNGAGGSWRKCNVCHDYTNRSPHLDPADPTRATYSDVGGPGFNLAMRICEECHSPASLHQIQANTNGGSVVVGGELAGYGHVGRDAGRTDSDCWGCHGFAMSSSDTLTGPVTPTVYNADLATIPAGKDTTVVLSGAAFTSKNGGTLYEADVRLTASNGSSVTLQPELVIDQGAMAVKIPRTTRPGNYKLQATHGNVESNPVAISVSPVARISRATYQGKVTILGTGFAGYAKGSPTSVTGTISTGSGKRVVTKTVEAKIVSWSDTKIVADFGVLPGKVTVNSIFGSSTASVSRK